MTLPCENDVHTVKFTFSLFLFTLSRIYLTLNVSFYLSKWLKKIAKIKNPTKNNKKQKHSAVTLVALVFRALA